MGHQDPKHETFDTLGTDDTFAYAQTGMQANALNTDSEKARG